MSDDQLPSDQLAALDAMTAEAQAMGMYDAPKIHKTGHAGIDFLHAWMRTPNPQFGGSAPLALMKLGRGHKVAQYIETAYELSCPPDKAE